MFDPERPIYYGCGTKRTRFTPAVNGGILSLQKIEIPRLLATDVSNSR